MYKCGMRNAECGTTSLHYVSLTRKDYISAERGVRNAERSAKHSAKFALRCKLNWLSPAKFPLGAKFAYRELIVANLI